MAAIIYCFSQFKSTIREIEYLCIYDLRVIYIMEQQQPSDTSIKDCINRYILPYQYEIFSMVTKSIIGEFNLDISNQYIDGTKIEANANKYKFVWKTVKFHKRLNEKIKELIVEMNLEYNDNKTIKSSTFKELINEYLIRENINTDEIPQSKGKRPTCTIKKKQKSTFKFIFIKHF